MSKFRLNYLIMFTEDGIPVYSRCFANLCMASLRDDVLLSAFLSSLNIIAQMDPSSAPEELILDDNPIKVYYGEEKGIRSINLEDLELIFYYTKVDEIIIASGFIYKGKQPESEVHQFMVDLESFLGKYSQTTWSNLPNDFIMNFEKDLLKSVVHPFQVKTHGKVAYCPYGENCFFRVSMYEGVKNKITDSIRETYKKYKKYNMMIRMKLMYMKFMFTPRYHLDSLDKI